MSWSVSVIGKVHAVKLAAAEQFGKINCAEPEQTIKNNVAAMVDAALDAYPSDQAVKVVASGSQYQPVHGSGKFINNVTLELVSLYGFVE